MKAILRAILSFLERKFPDRIEITMQEYKELREELGSLNQAVQAIPIVDGRLRALADDVALVKANLGYVASKKNYNPLER